MAKSKAKAKETVLQKKVMDYIKSNYPGSIAFKVDASIRGVPDVFSAIPGFGGFWMEMKRDETQKPRPDQVAVIARLNHAGSLSYVVQTFGQWMSIKSYIDNVIKHNNL